MKMLFRGYLLALAWLLLTTNLPAVTFVNDPFTDNSATNKTGGDTLGLVWFRNNTSGATLAVADDTSVTPPSKALVLTATSTFRGMLAFFPIKTLAAGQSLTLRFDFRFTTAPADNSQSFRFGLYNSGGTQQTNDATSTTRTNDFGYGIYSNAGADSTGGTRVFVESAGDEVLSGTVSLRALGTGGTAYACGTTTRHSAYLRITRLTDGSVILEGRLDNGTTARATITTTADTFYSFDTIALTNGGASATESFLIDNVTLALTAQIGRAHV